MKDLVVCSAPVPDHSQIWSKEDKVEEVHQMNVAERRKTGETGRGEKEYRERMGEGKKR